MLIKKTGDIKASDITTPEVWRRRRDLLKALAIGAGLLVVGGAAALAKTSVSPGLGQRIAHVGLSMPPASFPANGA
jgi:hypothetical protein